MTPITVLFLAACVGVGLGLTGWLRVPLELEFRIAAGAVVGAMAVTLTSLLTIAVAGFSGGAVVAAVAIAAAASFGGWRHLELRADARDLVQRLRHPWRDPSNPWPLLALIALTWPLTVRILSLAYQTDAGGGVAAGHLSVFGDWQAHLAYAGRFSYGGDLDLTTPLSAGDDFAYHFGVDLFAALAEPTGISLESALVVTTGYLAFAVPVLLYFFGLRLFERRSVAALGPVLFLAAGGFGFFRFFDDVQAQGWSVVWDQPRDYTRDFDELWMDNPVLGHLYPQRPTLVGFSVVLLALGLLWTARVTDDRRSMLWVGVMVGLTPLFHTFGWGTSLVMGAIWAAVDRRRVWWWFLVPAVGLAIPAVVWLLPPESSFRWHWGWVTDGSVIDIVRFWLFNTGSFSVLFIVGLLWRGAVSRRVALAIAPVWLWWIGVHLALPHPWPGNNAKYAIYWWMFGSFVVAAVLIEAARWSLRTQAAGRGVLALAGTAAVGVSLVLAGGLDVMKAVDGTSGAYPATVRSPGDQLVGEWARENTDDDAVFVVHTSSTAQPISSVAGRQVVSAFEGWVFDLGLDWVGRAEASRTILAGLDGTADAVETYGVDYVVIGPNEQREGADTSFWDGTGTLVYDLGGFRVYAVEPR